MDVTPQSNSFEDLAKRDEIPPVRFARQSSYTTDRFGSRNYYGRKGQLIHFSGESILISEQMILKQYDTAGRGLSEPISIMIGYVYMYVYSK